MDALHDPGDDTLTLDAPSRGVSKPFLTRVLAPYIPTGTDYLRSAEILDDCVHFEDADEAPIVTSRGRFSIPNSCYIQSTGHFNAVEFLICFNQLAYTTFAYCVAESVLANMPQRRCSEATRRKLKELDTSAFFRDQLSSMLILKAQTRFKRFIDASAFAGTLSMTSMSFRGDTLFVESNCRFTDESGGDAEGAVLLAYRRQAA